MKTEKTKCPAKEKGWKELPIGGIIVEPGNSDKYITGSWRSFRPIRDEEKCTNCLLCWIYCPDSAIKVKNGKVIEINMQHCKGCGICATECPIKAITMEEESKFNLS
ncbi:MAG: 4Fe-4S binding protein [bacterium]